MQIAVGLEMRGIPVAENIAVLKVTVLYIAGSLNTSVYLSIEVLTVSVHSHGAQFI